MEVFRGRIEIAITIALLISDVKNEEEFVVCSNLASVYLYGNFEKQKQKKNKKTRTWVGIDQRLKVCLLYFDFSQLCS